MEPELNLRQKLWEGLGSPVIDVLVKRHLKMAATVYDRDNCHGDSGQNELCFIK